MPYFSLSKRTLLARIRINSQWAVYWEAALFKFEFDISQCLDNCTNNKQFSKKTYFMEFKPAGHWIKIVFVFKNLFKSCKSTGSY